MQTSCPWRNHYALPAKARQFASGQVDANAAEPARLRLITLLFFVGGGIFRLYDLTSDGWVVAPSALNDVGQLVGGAERLDINTGVVVLAASSRYKVASGSEAGGVPRTPLGTQ